MPSCCPKSIALVGCLCLALAGCSGVGSRQIVIQPTSFPPNEEAIEQGAKDVFERVKLTGAPEVSELRKAIVSAPADWFVCLRSNAPPFHPYAIFFNANQLVDFRLAVLYDDCAREMYVPLAR